jgi:hypothetical protein
VIVQILISVVAYFVLSFLCANLLGFLVRGLFTNPELIRLKQDGDEFIKQEIAKSERVNKWINVIALFLIVAFIYSLFRFWNVWVVASVLLIIAGRLPDLL